MAYIERETALKTIDNYANTVTEDGKVIVDAIRDIVAVITPTADVAEVKHGEWKEHFSFDKWHYDCPFCDFGFAIGMRQESPPNYCENCGAKTDIERSAKQ